MGRAIPDEGLVGLRQYKYQSGQYSPLDNILNPFWEWSAKLLPLVRAAAHALWHFHIFGCATARMALSGP
jgi:hypothetical protein